MKLSQGSVGLLLAGLFLAPACVTARAVSIQASDGGLIQGVILGEGEEAVLLAHGGRYAKESWEPQVRRLVQAGFRTLAIDFRGFGQSPDRRGTEDLHLDLLAAVRYLRANGAKSVSILGGSMGGTAAMQAAAEAHPGEIDALILLAPGMVREPEKIQCRKLFVATREDERGEGVLRLPEIRGQFDRTPEPKEFLLLEGSAHAQQIFETQDGEVLMQAILRFLHDPWPKIYNSVTLSDGIDREECRQLAMAYFVSNVSWCGTLGDPVDRGEFWIVPMFSGVAALVSPPIRVEKRTGRIECKGYPSVGPPDAKRTQS